MEKLNEISLESIFYMILICFTGFLGGIGIGLCVTRINFKCFDCKKKTKIIPVNPKDKYIIVINPSENPQIGVINANN